MQWGNYTYVIELASRVLERQPDNVKLLYRRGVSYLEKGRYFDDIPKILGNSRSPCHCLLSQFRNMSALLPASCPLPPNADVI